MAIGIISDAEFEKEFGKLESHNAKVITVPKVGRIGPEVPESLRKVIGETAITEGRGEAVKLAAEFGIKPSSVSAYANGATSTSTYDTPDKDLAAHITGAKAKIGLKARNKLMMALNSITKEKLESVSVKTASSVARDMAAIVKDMEPVQKSEAEQKPQFIIYAPQFKEERAFDTIVVKE